MLDDGKETVGKWKYIILCCCPDDAMRMPFSALMFHRLYITSRSRGIRKWKDMQTGYS